MTVKRAFCILLIAGILLGLSSCGSDVPNTVFSVADLEGKTIGAVKGTAAFVRAGDTGYNDVTVIGFDNISAAVSALKTGKVDCLLVDAEDAPKAARSIGVTELSESLPDEEYKFAVAKENVDLTKAVNSALAVLKENGTLEDIIEGHTNDSDYNYGKKKTEYASFITMEVEAVGAPYCAVSISGELSGVEIDVAHAVCDILGVGLKVSKAEYNKLIIDAQKGRASFSAGRLNENDIGSEVVDFTDSYYVSSQKILVRK